MEMTSIYDGQFYGNVLVVGWSGCGKTFLEKLGVNNFFGKIVKTEWISGIDIDKQREAEIESCFSNEIEVHVAKERDELDSLIETFKLRSREESDNSNMINNSFGKNRKLDRLIIMDDVSDVSKKFANFLTVSRKFDYNCVYVFHFIVPASQIWEKIISQTNIFNIFHQLLHIIQLLKLFKVIVFYKVKNMFLLGHFGEVGFLLI